jgi:hypothetical protein
MCFGFGALMLSILRESTDCTACTHHSIYAVDSKDYMLILCHDL